MSPWVTRTQEHTTTSPVRASPWVTCMQEDATMSLVRATPQVTRMQEHNTTSSVRVVPWLTCMQEHDTCTTHTRLIKPKVRPWWVSSKSKTDVSLVDSPKAHQTQGPPLVSYTGSPNPRFILSKPRHSSTGLSKPKANMTLVQGSLNPRFILGEPCFC